MIIVDGKKIAAEILQKLDKTKRGGKRPSLSVFMVGNNPASTSFIKQKEKAAKTAKINFKLIRISVAISKKSLIASIKKEAKKNAVIVQLPLPSKFKNTKNILDAIPPDKDADCLSEKCLAKIIKNPKILPPTVLATKKILKKYKISLKNKKIAIIGMGRLVGLPMFLWLVGQNYSVVACDINTKNMPSVLGSSDVIISGVGRANFIKAKNLKKGSILIDFGFSRVRESDGLIRITGDFEFSSCSKKANLITPVPGGMGPITVACLFENILEFEK